jgi:hypothetical protein
MLNGFISPSAEIEEVEWVQASEYLHQQLLRALSEEVQVVCADCTDLALEQQLQHAIQEIVHQTTARMGSLWVMQRQQYRDGLQS